MKKTYSLVTVFILFQILTIYTVKAQVEGGAGFTGYKYLSGGIGRPLAVGLNLNADVEVNKKAKILLSASFFLPVTYNYNKTINDTGVPVVTHEQLTNVQLTALYVGYLIGNNVGGGFYVGIGPSVIFYNSTLTRDNYKNYNYSGAFKDYLLDGRAGVEIPMGLLRLFAEVDAAPKIFTDFKSNNVSYSPNTGTIFSGTVGLRIRI